ncbi:MAG: hypothetical protein V4675_24315 [Verrucomicrobiota bacterium]
MILLSGREAALWGMALGKPISGREAGRLARPPDSTRGLEAGPPARLDPFTGGLSGNPAARRKGIVPGPVSPDFPS